MNATDRVRAAVAAMAAGRGVLVVDDIDRENEGDVIFAAETVTDAQIAFLMRECRGLICVALDPADVNRLDLPLMVGDNADPFRTAFTVSVDAAHGVTTGISAADRALSARLLAAPATTRADLTAPGHIFPLRAHPGGVRSRRGHTEAAVDLARAAGLRPAGVICEVADDDGVMLTGPALDAFAARHNLPLVSIDDLAQALSC
ncbi:MAG: 3,4-dihydroxy-2-butanone-4-phosphate synthase [Cellulomonadaceae bacterium]|jgi:3,4-dihydroxy 2-butanone 4-phosphate synthase/GTP cyclohydrolase II|nr:3,4-dihydroxy-2-butanone-4-phosphate synthase [Cellulomonadaceae bacterium]